MSVNNNKKSNIDGKVVAKYDRNGNITTGIAVYYKDASGNYYDRFKTKLISQKLANLMTLINGK